MGNEPSKKPDPLPHNGHISRRNYHAPFPPKHKLDYKDPRNFVLPKELPVKKLRPVKKKFEPIPGIPEEEEPEVLTDVEIDRNSNLGSIQNLNLSGLNGSVDGIDKENSVPNGFTLGNGVLLNGHAPVIGNGELPGKQKRKHPAPPPPPPPPLPGSDASSSAPYYISSRSNSTSSLNSQAPSQGSNKSAEDKSKKLNGNKNVRRFSADMQSELIDQVRSRMKRPPQRHEPIEKPKTPLEIFQSELASVSADMKQRRASAPDWNAFERKDPIIIDVGYNSAANKYVQDTDTTLGAEIKIMSFNKLMNGSRNHRNDPVAHARSEDWVPQDDLKLEFEENKDDADQPIAANFSTDDEVMYRSGLSFQAKEPSLGSLKHYRSRSAEGQELEREPQTGSKRGERKSSYSKYSNSLRAFKRNMQQMFNSMGKNSISSKERGSVLDLFEDSANLDDFEDELAAMEEIDEEEIDMRQRRRVTFSPQPAQTREVVYYPGERDYHRRFPAGYYPPMYARQPPPFDPWYDEALRYHAPPPYRPMVPEGHMMYPDRRLLEMNYYHQMEDFHYFDPNSPSGMFYGRYGAGASSPPPIEKKKGKLSLRSRRRKLLEEARLKRHLAEEMLKRDMRERQRLKLDKLQKKEYNANWEMLRDDIQYDSGLVSSRIRPNKQSKERIHHNHKRSRSAPAASNSADVHWDMYNVNERLMLDGHGQNQHFPELTDNHDFVAKEYKYPDKDGADDRLNGDEGIDDVTALKNSRRRGHTRKKNGDIVSSSSDENKPPSKVLKSVLDEFDDIINSVPRDYSSSSEDEAGGGGGLGSVVKTIKTTKGKYGTQQEQAETALSRRDDVAL